MNEQNRNDREELADRDTNLGGDHARDTYRHGFGGNYGREDHSEPGAGVRGDNYGGDNYGGDNHGTDVEDKTSVHIGKASE
jgi:hypothetical protein